MRAGQISYYTRGKTPEEFDIISTEDYKLKLKKTWVEATSVWHIQLQSQSIFDNRFECFLTHEQVKLLKDAL
tara:strand:+ start:1658 stop:1873 length:216 start_codon:yes stop_codon:yes gene_type:complete